MFQGSIPIACTGLAAGSSFDLDDSRRHQDLRRRLLTSSLLSRALSTPSGLTTALFESAFGLRAPRFASSLRDGKAAMPLAA